jgi:adenosylcobinamide kinase/adenosylcobinamide-phosphate guanylyltransferase
VEVLAMPKAKKKETTTLSVKRNIIVLLGGARSGKSIFAQELATKLGEKVLFIATGEPLDDEMQARIKEHKKYRPKSWQTIEAPRHIGMILKEQISDAQVVIIDDLTLLVSNLIGDNADYPEAERIIMAEIKKLINIMDIFSVSFIIVSNEVGLGLVPDNKLGRIYRDLLGKVNQLIVQHANQVYLMTAGIPIKIKDI